MGDVGNNHSRGMSSLCPNEVGVIEQIQPIPIQHFIFITLLNWNGAIFSVNLIRPALDTDGDKCYLNVDKMKALMEMNARLNVHKDTRVCTWTHTCIDCFHAK